MESTKQRQYAYLAKQLDQLHANLQVTKEEMETMSSQCNTHLIGQLGKVNASWFIASNRFLIHEFFQNEKTSEEK
ncbi:similar to Saccharomyces cerevisiae YKL138C-A HSK3 Essential subunit of the Dam1 complex (aka DASH complex) [Maudiozyma saulgeensis]|uniref:Similar to Saccharomyces cerevisiae YKL138C-A HSK3 Essential subunit of the Dam1 complex (Aka DASH complex) n=1 Tax=Maudiozyma saulgeensis TaxID=1789683 RepID=A0A1X7R053_9SACH|nr:similar to Saccharomyces cerevisiae YKL138C-A HSK3 Essential subunit of the Dam1 complex (aka DASH complex) [Kazachstania saulgeensis]